MAGSQPEARSLPLAKFLAPGMRLGKYQLTRQLAIGGMAEVYLARATGIEGFTKRVVLKRILPQFATNEEFIKMFLDEARLAAKLDHPNVVQVYDIGQTVGNYYFTMEYVQGQDVRTILKTEHRAGRAVPLSCALTIARGLCAGLHYAHEKTDLDGRPLGIVHRDVSLSNVLVSYDGAVKIVDFGVAKCVAKETQTRAGTLKGKIAYMSPEQCRGEPLDRRSDVFALGIILFELTTGTRLFTGDSEFAILQNIATRDVESPATRVPGYPPELERIVLKALRRDRAERYQTAREMLRDIEAFARDQRVALSAIELSDYMHELFAEEIAAQPSDSGLNDPARFKAAATKAATPRPRRAEQIESGDDDSIMVIDATDREAAGGAVHTSMFEGPAAYSIADGSGEHESAAAERTAPPRPTRPRSRAAVFLAAAALSAVAFAALAMTRPGVAVDPAPPPDVPAVAAEPEVVNPVRVVPDEPPQLAPTGDVKPNPSPRKPKPAAKATRTKRAKTAKSKKSKKSTWDPDSPLPPSP